MLTTAPYLRIRRPSPTTAEFTVSTLPPLTTPLRILLHVLNLLRIVLALAVALVLYAVWTYHVASPPTPANDNTPTPTTPPSALSLSRSSLQHLLHTILISTPPGRLATRLATSPAIPPWALVPLCAAALCLASLRVHAEESLLVLRGLGIQTSSGCSTSSSRGGGGGGRFIPTEKIRDVLINEAFWGFGVRSYLVVVVDGEEDVVVVFPRLLPGARIVERVWRGVRECLYEEEGGRSRGGSRKGARIDGGGGGGAC